jgi:hypothetical protein
MDRADAIALLKELTNEGLVNPQMISIGKNEKGTFSLMLKPNGHINAVRKIAAAKGLAVNEDKEKGYCTIYKP